MGTCIRVTGLLLCCLLFVSVTVVAQGSADKTGKTSGQVNNGASTQDALTGKFEGTAKSGSIGDMAVTLELINQAGKISGKLESPHGVGMIREGTYEAGKISIKFDFAGEEGVITGQLKGDAITGDWNVGGVGGSLALKRVVAGATAAAAPMMTAATVDSISGEWNAAADADGQAVPFVLKLKLDGENVTGESSSQLGISTGKGTWKDGTLSLKLDGQSGSVMFVATIKEGKLVGDFDYNGQLQGKWVAIKK